MPHHGRLYASLCALALSLVGSDAAANLCSNDADSRGAAEATALEGELFNAPVAGDSVNTDFDRGYNARVITCNRKRDTKGNKIEAEIGATHVFAEDLPAKTVKGHYSYLGLGIFSQLRYAYQLSRDGGTWIVTVPIELHWPTARKTDMIDLPQALAAQLGLEAPGEICEPGTTVYSATDPRRIDQGPITWELGAPQSTVFQQEQLDRGEDPAKVVATRAAIVDGSIADDILNDVEWDVAYYKGEESCRVPRELVVDDPTTSGDDSLSVLNHLRVFWHQKIDQIWSRPGFEIRPRFINCETPPAGTPDRCDKTVTATEMSAWEKDETIWHVRFNLKPYHRPSFKRWAFKWNHMHTGSHANTVAHELGHLLGLDDEYKEGNNDGKHCKKVLPDAGKHYIMCDSDAGRAGAQGLYAWIITRRYAIAKEYQCKRDGDCDAGEFCARHGLNRNVCEQTRSEGSKCSKTAQCGDGMKCQGAPLGKCIFVASVAMGDECIKDAQCESGSCDKDGRCQCKEDDDCPAGERCYKPLGKKHYCERTDKPLGASCSKNSHCASDRCESGECVCKDDADCPSGEACFTPVTKKNYCESTTKPLGASCSKNAHCASDKCESGECVCKDDADCPSGEACFTPATKKNYCESTSKPLGASCSKNAHCASDKCESGECVCKDDADCPSGEACFTPVTKKNYCESTTKPLGASCSKNAHCASDKCESGECVCKKDTDCPNGQRCKTPITKKNYCR